MMMTTTTMMSIYFIYSRFFLCEIVLHKKPERFAKSVDKNSKQVSPIKLMAPLRRLKSTKSPLPTKTHPPTLQLERRSFNGEKLSGGLGFCLDGADARISKLTSNIKQNAMKGKIERIYRSSQDPTLGPGQKRQHHLNKSQHLFEEMRPFSHISVGSGQFSLQVSEFYCTAFFQAARPSRKGSKQDLEMSSPRP